MTGDNMMFLAWGMAFNHLRRYDTGLCYAYPDEPGDDQDPDCRVRLPIRRFLPLFTCVDDWHAEESRCGLHHLGLGPVNALKFEWQLLTITVERNYLFVRSI